MPTTVHLPQSLLEKIDSRAKALGVSRNRFIMQALSEKVELRVEWPDDFVRALKRPVSKDVAALGEELEQLVKSTRRNRKQPPKL